MQKVVPLAQPSIDALPACQGLTAVLFLDFDGVLQTPELEGWRDMEHCAGLIACLETYPHVAVVVVSTHREGRSVSALQLLLPREVGAHVIGSTSVFPLGRAKGGRQAEIEAWLSLHPEVQTWVAVDDEPDLYRANCPWLVLTHKWVGWDEQTTDAVQRRLACANPAQRQVPHLSPEQEAVDRDVKGSHGFSLSSLAKDYKPAYQK